MAGTLRYAQLAGICVLVFCGLAACDDRAGTSVKESKSMPPGFMDEPPPPPTSNTVILSGGVLLADSPITDSVVVIADGVITAWGHRGEVDLPNDSIGIDMRGKWIRGSNGLTSGSTADLLIYDQFPVDENIAPIGSVKRTEISMPQPD